ncbi:MAG: protein-glutamate O-methyltransferase CheR [Candidatus Riflebacteria bacterium]|nr:protein-glutamate O-methyltransferase CheR [Candidatus Riflebacteria bacterium]
MGTISLDEIKIWANYIYSISGIHLDESKGYLFESRLSNFLTETKSSNFSELFFKVRTDPDGNLKKRIISAIATGETSFFRDIFPFEALKYKILPDLIDSKSKTNSSGNTIPIRIWSSACSSGQEVYSIAMEIVELLGNLNPYEIKILGTDISSEAITKASRGIYSKMEVERGVSAEKLLKYFRSEGDNWRICDEIRALANFKTQNLLEPFFFPNKFDIIFCRNIAIYFREQDKINLFNKISNVLAPRGYLIIGSTESISGICQNFEPKNYLRTVFYQRL